MACNCESLSIIMPRGDVRSEKFEILESDGETKSDIEFDDIYFTVKRNFTDTKYLFQKRYDNEQGDTLYFLDINKWDWSFAGDRVPEKYTYQIETQLYKKGDHEAINVEFGSNITVEDAEKFIQAMFDADLIEPYSCDE